MNSTIKFSECVFSMPCKRRHMVFDQDYYLYLFSDELIITKNQLDGNAKYRFKLNLKQMVHFMLKDRQYEAFGLEYRQVFKWFHAKHEDITQIKKILGARVLFSHVLDLYEPKISLGFGVSSQVYIVKDIVSGKEFASKCIPKSFLKSTKDNLGTESDSTLTNEIEILKSLNHSNVISVYEVYEGQHTYYIIMELLKGQTLGKFIRNMVEPVQMIEIRAVLKQLLEAVDHIHKQGVIHRDLKPDNIMFKDPNNICSLKILDFGFATKTDVAEYRFPKCGTPGYVAPEILNLTDKTMKYSNKCDIFSCGVIFYKLLTRQNLFQGVNTEAILKLNKRGHINLTLLVLYKIPKEAYDLITKLLKIDPRFRLSAEEALQHPFFFENVQTPILVEFLPQPEQINEDIIADDPVMTQTLPQSIKPNLKPKSEFSFVRKEDLTLKTQTEQKSPMQVFSPQQTRNTPLQFNQESGKDYGKVLSVGAKKKRSHFVYFQQQQAQQKIQQMLVQEEVPENEDDS